MVVDKLDKLFGPQIYWITLLPALSFGYVYHLTHQHLYLILGILATIYAATFVGDTKLVPMVQDSSNVRDKHSSKLSDNSGLLVNGGQALLKIFTHKLLNGFLWWVSIFVLGFYTYHRSDDLYLIGLFLGSVFVTVSFTYSLVRIGRAAELWEEKWDEIFDK